MPRPQLIPVESTAVEAVGYDEERRELYVRFRGSDGTYVYAGVSPEKYRALGEADSIGGYVNREIKPHHSYRQLDD